MVIPNKNKIWDYESNSNDRLAEQVKKNNDIVNTSNDMAKHLISLIKFKKNDIVLEPCKGTGSFFNNFPEHTINKWCEINEDKDYFDFNERVDYVISNPPFVPRKLFWEFHLHSMSICNKEIYWLINLSALNVFTPKRLEIMKEKGWFINSLHIVSDKRWFGRYVFVKITKKNNNFISWNQQIF